MTVAWRTDLPRSVLVLQIGNAVNSFGFGLVLPFEILYLHVGRGFATTTAGLVLATIMATAAVTAAPAGALLDRISPKAVLVAASLSSGIGYGGLAFVSRPWEAFLCSVAAGIGFGSAMSAAPTLVSALVTREQRPSSFALARVSLNVGIGSGALVGALIAAGGALRSYQQLYLLDALTFGAFALIVALRIPNVRMPSNGVAEELTPATFRTVAKDRVFIALLGANVVLVIVGYTLFANLLAPYAKIHTTIAPRSLGLLFLFNTTFIVVAQMPAAGIVKRLRRTRALAGLGALWAVTCLLVLPAQSISSPVGVTVLLCGVAVLFGIGECVHAVVAGPIVVDLAPPHLLGRYLSLFSLSVTAGYALGPALGSILLSASPSALWWGGALAVAAVGFAFLALEGRIPDPLRSTAGAPESVLAQSVVTEEAATA